MEPHAWVALTIPAGAGLTPLSGAVSDTGITVFGGTPGGSSTAKIRESSNGTTWNSRNTVATGTIGVKALHWFDAASKFVAGLDNAATTNIETSSNGQTWAQITGLPNSTARGSMMSNSTTLIVLPSSSSNKCLSSTDAATFSERTLPHTEVWAGGYWDTTYERFVAIGETNVVYSDDGITWSSAGAHGITGGAAPFKCVASGRVAFVMTDDADDYGLTLVDTTITVRKVLTPGGDAANCAFGDGRFFATRTNGEHYWTIAGGDL